MKTFAVLLTAIFASRIRREGSTFRVTYGSFIPKQIRTFSPFRDNVVTMVALKMKETGMKKADMRESLENLFEHGCHCSWNKGRHTLKKRPGVGVDSLDGFCHEYEHCLECLKIDGCDTETQEFSPTVLPGANFTCDNLKGNDCQYNACLCSHNLAEKLYSAHENAHAYSYLSFTEFMDECAHEIDASVNTQLTEDEKSNRAKYPAEKKCCGDYPARKPFIYRPVIGHSCCNNKNIFSLKSHECCKDGSVQAIGTPFCQA